MIRRLPINTRQGIRTLSAYRGGPGDPEGRSNGADIWINGNATNRHTILIHETMHNLDCQAGSARSSSGATWASSSAEWHRDVDNDSCVVDEYGLNNDYVEVTGHQLAPISHHVD